MGSKITNGHVHVVRFAFCVLSNHAVISTTTGLGGFLYKSFPLLFEKIHKRLSFERESKPSTD
jgi:hypothetical protein